jgi:hypothetical protein
VPPLKVSEADHSGATLSHHVKIIVGGLLVCGLFVFGGFAVYLNWLAPEKERLAREYAVSEDQIFIEPQPHTAATLTMLPSVTNTVISTEPNCKVRAVFVYWRKVEE